MKITKSILYKFSVLFISSLIFAFIFFVYFKEYLPIEDDKLSYEKNIEITNPKEKIEDSPKEKELKRKNIGLWVPYMSLDFSKSTNLEDDFKRRFQEMIEKAKLFNVNNLYVNIRMFSDSMYPSKIYPWSHLLTGVQDKDPGFDPLKYMIEISHNNNMNFHAWVNPLRGKLKNVPRTISDKSPLNKFDKKYFFNSSDGKVCFNPGYQEVRDLITQGVKEIAEKDDVDGIHIDDYFYPTEIGFVISDSESYKKESISLLLKQVYNSIKSINPKIKFGISPSGNFKMCDKSGLDIERICSEGLVDYICPQIYWSLENKTMPFESVAKYWKDTVSKTNVDLYAGIALYKLGTDADGGTWNNDNNILRKEFEILENLGYKETVLYSLMQLDTSKEAIKKLQEKLKS